MLNRKDLIINIGNIKESQVFAFFTARLDTLGTDNLNLIQIETALYAKNLADSFIKDYNDFFEKEENKIAILRYIDNTKQSNTRRQRFWEEVDNQINQNINNLEDSNNTNEQQ